MNKHFFDALLRFNERHEADGWARAYRYVGSDRGKPDEDATAYSAYSTDPDSDPEPTFKAEWVHVDHDPPPDPEFFKKLRALHEAQTFNAFGVPPEFMGHNCRHDVQFVACNHCRNPTVYLYKLTTDDATFTVRGCDECGQLSLFKVHNPNFK